MRRIAVVGSGVSGLTAAHLLARTDRVTLFEADDRLGGHAHTHTVAATNGPVAVDSGFIVHNDRTYPLLTRLFSELGVAVRDTEMSMSVTDPSSGIEYAGGRGIHGFVARPRQFLRRDYVTMLAAVRRFHRLASAFLAGTDDDDTASYGEFIERHRFGRSFVDLYAVPLVSCVWSSGRSDALEYPARYLFRFLEHHGMLSVSGSPRWRTVVGGSATYVDALARRLHETRTNSPVSSIERGPGSATVTSRAGREVFDAVVVATHADTALQLLSDASVAEKEVLGAFRYSTNRAVLHSDHRMMPRTAGVRAAWNYTISADPRERPAVTYWMNRLQGIDPSIPLFVTLNAADRMHPDAVLARMDYRHPIYDRESVTAQRRLPELATPTTVFAGAYHGWGFHEDGCRSGAAAAAHLGCPW